MTLAIPAERIVYACVAVMLYALLCARIAYTQWRARHQAARDAAILSAAPAGAMSWLIAYASQTGNAEHLAWHTARLLHTAGVPSRVVPLAQVQAADLSISERALFIVSTYGEGDAPDNAAIFARSLMSRELPLKFLHYGVLALGDRNYRHFCGFGIALNDWLNRQGAQALFECIEVDNNNASTLTEYQHRLSHVVGTNDMPDWQAPAYESWRLAARQLMNEGSKGGPCFHLELEPVADDSVSTWQAGDLVQIQPPADPQRPREYSIASIPADGRVHLLIRQERHDDGSVGIASGWLTEQLQPGEHLKLRVRSHGNFHLGENTLRPLILIGNGTGLAGLRSHIKARAALSEHCNWLIFGERNSAHDSYYAHEIAAWLRQGVLQRIDLVFSRDQTQREYVQDRLRTHATLVREWIDAGAAFYICGSLEGMASGVEAALIDIAGADCVEQLMATGRYRRDVY